MRADYYSLSPKFAEAFMNFSLALKKASVIEPEIRDLVTLRASQINGCAFCVDMHVKEARLAGERELRLHHLPIWRESPLFSARERAALEWTETLTRLGAEGVSDAAYAQARVAFSEKELSDLTFSVVAINGWNRLSVAFRPVPGSMDAAWGLDKAGLS